MNVSVTVSRTHNFLSYKKYGHVVSTGYFLLSWLKSTPPRNQNQGFLYDRLRGESYVIRTFIVSIRIYIYKQILKVSLDVLYILCFEQFSGELAEY